MPYKASENRKSYQRKYQRQWISQRRANFFTDKYCTWRLPSGSICGATETLELDHIDPKTKITNKIWSWSKERRDIEIAKCQILCHFHHLEKTKINGDKQNSGEDHCQAKLTNKQVLDIREKYASGHYSYRTLSVEYKIHFTQVGEIVRKEIWKHI